MSIAHLKQVEYTCDDCGCKARVDEPPAGFAGAPLPERWVSVSLSYGYTTEGAVTKPQVVWLHLCSTCSIVTLSNLYEEMRPPVPVRIEQESKLSEPVTEGV